MNVQNLYGIPAYHGGATTTFGAYNRGIGYANRVGGVGGWWQDFIDGPTGSQVGSQVGSLVNALLGKVAIKGKEAVGYTNTGQVREYQGKLWLVMRTPNNLTVLVDENGNETPFTGVVQTTSAAINPQTGMIAAAGIGAAVLVGVALLFFLNKR